MLRERADLVIIGGGVAGRAAAEILPQARLITRPQETVWHAQDNRLWIETADALLALGFDRLLLCADELLLLRSLGCAFEGAQLVVDARGETSRPGIFAAGCVLGATTPQEATAQARIAARALAGMPIEGRIASAAPAAGAASPERLDPVGIADLLERPPGPERNRLVLAQAAFLGALAPARPVSFALLAAAAGPVDARPAQQDAERLS